MDHPATQYDSLLLSRRRLVESLETPEGREKTSDDDVGGKFAAQMGLWRSAVGGTLGLAAARTSAEGGSVGGGGESGAAALIAAVLENSALGLDDLESDDDDGGEDGLGEVRRLETLSLCRVAEKLAADYPLPSDDALRKSEDNDPMLKGWLEDPDGVVADADSFFEDYPSCVRSDYDSEEGDSSDSSGDSEEERRRQRRKRKKQREKNSASSRSGSSSTRPVSEDAKESTKNGESRPSSSSSVRQHQSRPQTSPGRDVPPRNPYGRNSLSSQPSPGGDGEPKAPSTVGAFQNSRNSGQNPQKYGNGRLQSSDGYQSHRNGNAANFYDGGRPGSSGSNGWGQHQHQQGRQHQANWGDWDGYDQPNAWGSYNGHAGISGSAAPAAAKANPFRTASEYAASGECEQDDEEEYGGNGGHGGGDMSTARAGGGSAGVGGGRLGGPPNFIQRGLGMHPNGAGGVNGNSSNNAGGYGGGGYANQGRDSISSNSGQNYVKGGPPISEGLRKKYQPPKRGATGGGKGSKKTGGGGGGQAHKNSGGGQDDDDDDDLPEELKGLDKELIEKIQNEIVDAGEPVTFDDIAGLADAKQTVLELVCWPMKRPDLFTGLRRGPNGLLLFGPPGTGKTLIGKAIAHESGATFFSISSSSLTSKWIGEGEKLVRTLFKVAQYREPSVVFIDEIDSLLTQRKADENEASRRIKTEFLVQLDGTGTGEGRVLCVGATNRPNELDEAARRRFVKRLYVPLPERPDREVLIRVLLGKNRHRLSEREIVKLSDKTMGFSGADLRALCADAALGPIRQLGPKALEVDPDNVPPISYGHFKKALRGMKPSVADGDLKVYLEFDSLYGSKGAAAAAAEGQADDDDSEESDAD